MRITSKNTRKLFMKNFNKLPFALLIGMVISGCSLMQSSHDDCDQITIIALLPPVVVDLDYKDIRGSQNQVIVQGGFQHALAIPGQKKAINVITSPMQFEGNAIKQTKTILFEFDHYSIPSSELYELNTFVNRIDSPKLIHVQVEGYTDSKGSAKYNRALSSKRAKTVRDYLVQHGIQAAKISIEGFGKNLPLEPNNTETNRAKNRRAVIIPLTGY